MSKYEADKRTYESDLKAFEDKVKQGKEKAEELSRRFAGWYYVISSDSFEKFRITRNDVVSKKEAEEENSENENEEIEETEGNKNEEGDNDDEAEDEEDEEKKAPEPLDFTIQFKDAKGELATTKLSDYSYLQRQLSVDVLKNTELQSTKGSEAIYNTFFMDLSKLNTLNPAFNIEAIASLEFIFDQSKKGLIILDKIAVH